VRAFDPRNPNPNKLTDPFPRTRESLRAGNLIVAGDDWPLFLYQDYKYYADDVWRGLFRSALLVSVSVLNPGTEATRISAHLFKYRLSDISSPPQVPSIGSHALPDLGMPVYTECKTSPYHRSPMSQHRCAHIFKLQADVCP
jgi:hypothetical protein